MSLEEGFDQAMRELKYEVGGPNQDIMDSMKVVAWAYVAEMSQLSLRAIDPLVLEDQNSGIRHHRIQRTKRNSISQHPQTAEGREPKGSSTSEHKGWLIRLLNQAQSGYLSHLAGMQQCSSRRDEQLHAQHAASLMVSCHRQHEHPSVGEISPTLSAGIWQKMTPTNVTYPRLARTAAKAKPIHLRDSTDSKPVGSTQKLVHPASDPQIVPVSQSHSGELSIDVASQEQVDPLLKDKEQSTRQTKHSIESQVAADTMPNVVIQDVAAHSDPWSGKKVMLARGKYKDKTAVVMGKTALKYQVAAAAADPCS